MFRSHTVLVWTHYLAKKSCGGGGVEFSSCSCSMVSPFGSGDLLLFLDVEINEGLKVLPRVSLTCSDTVESKPSISATSQPEIIVNGEWILCEGMRKYYLITKVFVDCMYDDNMLK